MDAHSILFYIGEQVGKHQVDAIPFIDSEGMYIVLGSKQYVAFCS